jgi:hypothetical protein
LTIRNFLSGFAPKRLTENATWDDRLLAQQLRKLSLLGLDFSTRITGFLMGKIDLRIASLEPMTVGRHSCLASTGP